MRTYQFVYHRKMVRCFQGIIVYPKRYGNHKKCVANYEYTKTISDIDIVVAFMVDVGILNMDRHETAIKECIVSSSHKRKYAYKLCISTNKRR
jgi:hypothetical protein